MTGGHAEGLQLDNLSRRASEWWARRRFGSVPGAVCALSLAFGAAVGVYAFHHGYTITHDDAYISFKYAANLASGRGLVFNPGERVWGFTSPLQTLLLGLLGFLGFDIPPLSLALALLWISLTACLMFHLSRGIFSTSLPAFAVALYALTYGGGYSYLGLETNLLIFLEVLFLLLVAGGHPRWAAVVGGFACLARPDAVVLVGPVLLGVREGRRAKSLALFLAPGLVWLLFAVGYFGDLLPNTLYAKKAVTALPEFLAQIGRWVTDPFGSADSSVTLPLSWWHRTLSWLLALASLLPLANRRLRERPALLYALVLYPWALVLAYGLIGAPTAHRWEYFPAFIFLRLSALVGVLSVLENLAGQKLFISARPIARRMAVSCAALLCLLFFWNGADCFRKLDRQQEDYWYGLRYRDYAVIADWVNKNLPRGETLQVLEVGIIGYWTDMRIIDMAGLTTKGFRAENIRDYPRYLLHYRPRYVLMPGIVGDLDRDDLHYRRRAFFPGKYGRFSLMARIGPGA